MENQTTNFINNNPTIKYIIDNYKKTTTINITIIKAKLIKKYFIIAINIEKEIFMNKIENLI